jgi:hypothetical protein
LEKHPVPMLAAEFSKGKLRKNPESGVLAGSSSDSYLCGGCSMVAARRGWACTLPAARAGNATIVICNL